MDSTNYVNFRINFQLNYKDKCLNRISLQPENCIVPKQSRFEKVTFGDNTYALVEDTYQNCFTDNGTMGNFKNGGCKVFSFKDKINNAINPSFNSTLYIGHVNDEDPNKYIPDKKPTDISNRVFTSIPTLPANYKKPVFFKNTFT